VLVAAAVCPHPPLLIPEAMGQAAIRDATGPAQPSGEASGHPADAQLAELRGACHRAVRQLALAAPDLIVVVGGAARTRDYPGSAAGSLAGFGIPYTTGSGEPVLPLSLTVGAWLIRELSTPWPASRLGFASAAWSMRPAECLRLGERIAARAGKVALLVMGDGSARRVTGVPGVADPDARAFDQGVADALAGAAVGDLAALNPDEAARYLAAGRAAWQVLAGAGQPCRCTGQLQYAAAPLDATYFVASWLASRDVPGQDDPRA
jgi:hypothetical protein